LIPKGSKFRNNLSQQQMNQSPQFFQFWIANAMVNSSVHAYYIMLITFFFLKYFVIFSHFFTFSIYFVQFWDPNVNLCFYCSIHAQNCSYWCPGDCVQISGTFMNSLLRYIISSLKTLVFCNFVQKTY
jgi:hypothetical protein